MAPRDLTGQVYTTGVASFLALTLPLTLAAVRVRARLLPPVTAATARLSEAIVALAILIVLSEALGAVGLFRRVPLLIGCWCVAGAVFMATRSTAPAATLERSPDSRLGSLTAAAGVGIVIFAFGVGTFSALHGANWDIDSIGYHLPESLRFAQSHRLTGIQFTSVDPAPAYYPANSELIHAVGMVLFSRDVLTLWVNIAFAALALLAGWCLGEESRCAPATLLAIAALAVAPQIAQGGNALNDGVGLTLMIAAAALGLSPSGPRVRAVGALAAGLAVGTKLNLAAPVAALAVSAIVLADGGRRFQSVATWVVGILTGSGFWFARNLAHTGSPLPLLKLGPLPHVALLPGESTNMLDALRAGTLSAHQVTSSLSAALGRAWPVLLAAALAGLVWGAWRGSDSQRAYGLVGMVALASFPLTPLTGSQFGWTVRYAAAPLALGLALLATVPARSNPAWGQRWAPPVLFALTAVSLRPPAGSHTGAVLLGVLTAVAVAMATRSIPRPSLAWLPTRRGALVLAATLAALMVAGYPVTRAYVRHQFGASPGTGRPAAGLMQLAHFGQTVNHARIAIVGMELQYQLAGVALSNHVQYVGKLGRHGSWSEITSCVDWRRAVDAGHYRYVVTAPPFWPTLGASLADGAAVPAAPWTAGDPNAREILRPYPTVSVFELTGPLRSDRCDLTAGGRRYHRAAP